jgi:aspartyl-tRNA(Asn)/glutamyl-tRNA(Gln) amidotransferase subunit C
MITKEALKKYANLLMFDMSDTEYQTLEEEFNIILKQMALIGKIAGIENVKPMHFPIEIYQVLPRDDDKVFNLTVEEVLKNAKETSANQVKVPKVVE